MYEEDYCNAHVCLSSMCFIWTAVEYILIQEI